MRKQISDIIGSVYDRDHVTVDLGDANMAHLVGMDVKTYIAALTAKMRMAAADLEFEEAALLRDEIMRLEAFDLDMPVDAAPVNIKIAASIQSAPKALGSKKRPRNRGGHRGGGRGRARNV